MSAVERRNHSRGDAPSVNPIFFHLEIIKKSNEVYNDKKRMGLEKLRWRRKACGATENRSGKERFSFPTGGLSG